MKQDEMLIKIAQIEKDAQVQKNAVYEEYVRDNAKYKIGDIVCDSCDRIRVESVRYSTLWNDVAIYYYGPIVTRKGVPRNGGSKMAVFECNIKQ